MTKFLVVLIILIGVAYFTRKNKSRKTVKKIRPIALSKSLSNKTDHSRHLQQTNDQLISKKKEIEPFDL